MVGEGSVGRGSILVSSHDSMKCDALGTDCRYRERFEALVWYFHHSKHLEFRETRLGIFPTPVPRSSEGWLGFERNGQGVAERP
jgi:hypothetical protein